MFKNKKDITCDFNEMKNLCENEIASTTSTLTEERLKALLDEVDSTTVRQYAPACAPTCSPCGNCTSELPFCCCVTVPKGFAIDSSLLKDVKITYNSFLAGFVDPCPCEVTCTPGANCPPVTLFLYPKRVFGSISYVVSVDCIKGNCFAPSSANSVAVSCQYCEGVNAIISYQQCPPTSAEKAFRCIHCGDIDVTDLKAEEMPCTNPNPSNVTAIRFSGKFVLPTDFDPAPTCPVIPTCPPITCP